ncbi:DUF4183 domain-containing protein [Pontibacillus salicampi]|uniref:DUF4183 domain-containing protein n=1 Tax=Pontibacillus salicampi TaxID=1449801 RepID=A0ABV6LUE0_9BACI
MVKISLRSLIPPAGCPNIYPYRPAPPTTHIRATTYYYYTIADGTKNIFTSADAITAYGAQGILSQEETTYINLYVNGMIQPDVIYSIRKDVLILPEAPADGVPIILQFVILHLDN